MAVGWRCIDPAAVARARAHGVQLPWGERQPTRDEFWAWAAAWLLETCMYIDPAWARQEAARVLRRAAEEGHDAGAAAD